MCVKACISGALSIENGIIRVDQDKMRWAVIRASFPALTVAILPSDKGIVQKCELCIDNAGGEPNCVKELYQPCIVFEER